MATSARDGWSDLHMIVLGTIMEHAIVDAEDVAAWLRLPVPLVHALAGDASWLGSGQLAFADLSEYDLTIAGEVRVRPFRTSPPSRTSRHPALRAQAERLCLENWTTSY
jgi:hypothetical protein